MHATLFPVAALLTGTAILLGGAGLLTILLPVRAALEQFSTLLIGLIAAAYFAGFVVGCVTTPHVVKRVGHIRAFAALAATAACAALVHPLHAVEWAWIVLRAATGFCLAGLYMVIESWLNERATNETRGRIFSTYMVVNLLAVTAGQLLLATADPVEFHLFAIAAIGICFALVPVALTGASAPPPLVEVRLRLLRLYGLSPVGVVGCLFVGIATGAFWGLAPVYAGTLGMTVPEIAIFMSVAVVGGALGQWPLGRLSDRMDRRRVIIATCLGAVLISLALVVLPPDFRTVALALSALLGGFMFSLYPLSVAHANDFTPADEFVEVSSGLLLTFGLGAVAGPLIGSALMTAIGNAGVFLHIAIAFGLLATFAFLRMRRRERPPEAERTDFVAMPISTPEASLKGLELDPRAPDMAEEAPETPVDTAETREGAETTTTLPDATTGPSSAPGGT